MGRSPCCSKEGLNRGSWTAIEDRILTAYIKAHGEGKWRNLPKRAGLKRCGKSCRLRWLNYLRPDIKRGNISSDEEELMIRLHKLLGNRWSLIAGRLPGRTDNEIKNYWNTTLGKKVGALTSPESSKQSPKSKSRAKRPASEPNSSSEPAISPPAAIRTKALRCTRVLAIPATAPPTSNSNSLSINSTAINSLEPQSHDQSHLINSEYWDKLKVECCKNQELLRVEYYCQGTESFKFSCDEFQACHDDDDDHPKGDYNQNNDLSLGCDYGLPLVETGFKDWTASEFLDEDNGDIDIGSLASLLDCEEW